LEKKRLEKDRCLGGKETRKKCFAQQTLGGRGIGGGSKAVGPEKKRKNFKKGNVTSGRKDRDGKRKQREKRKEKSRFPHSRERSQTGGGKRGFPERAPEKRRKRADGQGGCDTSGFGRGKDRMESGKEKKLSSEGRGKNKVWGERTSQEGE